MTSRTAVATAAASEAMDISGSDSDRAKASLDSRSSSVDSARAVAAAHAYDTATIAIIPGLVVPLTSVSSTGGCAALASAVASLEALANTMDTVLDRLDKAAASQQRCLDTVQRRIGVCADLVGRLKGRSTSTLLESKPRYPQLVPRKPRGGGGRKTKAVKSSWDAHDGAIINGVPSPICTAHSHRFLRPRRSSPLPPVAPSSCSGPSTDDSDDGATQRPPPPSYQPPMRAVPEVSALATPERAGAVAHRGGSGSDVSSPAPPVNAVASMRLAEWMPLETVLWDGEDGSAVLMEQGMPERATAAHLNGQGAPMNAASLQQSSSSVLTWQPGALPPVRGGQVMRNACEMPSTLTALVSFPAHQMAYRHLAEPSSSISDANSAKALALLPHSALIHRDPYSLAEHAVTARSTTKWLLSASTVDIQSDFTTPLQSQQYAFVPGGDAAAASSRALLRDMPRNLPLQHLATVRRWDQRGSNVKSRSHGSTDTEDGIDEGVYEVDDHSGSRQRRRAPRRGPGGLETIAPGPQQRQRRARRRRSLSDDGTDAEGSEDEAEAAASDGRRGRESDRARSKQQQPRKVSASPTATGSSIPPAAPPSLAPPPPPPPGVARSTTAPPPPPLPPPAFLKGKTNPPMLLSGSGGGAPPRLPPPPPPPNFVAELKSAVEGRPPPPPPPPVQAKTLPSLPSRAPQPPPPPPPLLPPSRTSSQLPVGVKPGGGPVAAPAAPRVPPPPPPPPTQSQKSAASALTSVLGERRRVLQSDYSSSISSSGGGEKMTGGADGGDVDCSDSSSLSLHAAPSLRRMA
ncbi:hypothetical protein LSCM1_07465 [Leishmania martiniquensis]|uniref:WASH1 WAHD domain-containing protein n=1 Tax=Leishmania martiniquensis TaxID=1580590 RepID=A0A836I357_9TRYP|nr:hypothetical protein LSCM1_07465 [Leishmania martiniquensis]